MAETLSRRGLWLLVGHRAEHSQAAALPGSWSKNQSVLGSGLGRNSHTAHPHSSSSSSSSSRVTGCRPAGPTLPRWMETMPLRKA